MHNLFRRKSLDLLLKVSEKTPLARTLTAFDLTLMGIGSIIGTGIFVFTGVGAAKYAGPALVISYIIAGIVCLCSALAYAELSAMIPVTGGAYIYSYTVLGEVVAWLVGWALLFECAGGCAAVSSGWSQYVVSLLNDYFFTVPKYLCTPPSISGGGINIIAPVLIAILIAFLYRGTSESAKLNRVLVFVKLAIVFVFLFLAAPHINTANWTPFMPFGWGGVFAGAGFAFAAYLGFDNVAGAAEECKNPKRDLPLGILGALAICALLYLAVTLTMTGTVNYKLLDTGAPVVFVLGELGYRFGSALLGTAIILGLAAGLLVGLYGQIRILYALSRDGLLPSFISAVHPKHRTPYVATLIIGVIDGALAMFVNLESLGEVMNMGTLFAFIAVAAAVFFLRISQPRAARPFRCPVAKFTMLLAMAGCVFLMCNLSAHTWLFFSIWCAIGLLLYFSYGYKNSELHPEKYGQ